MDETKPDFYSGVHKGLRRALFAVTSEAARVDAGDDARVAALQRDVEQVLALMDAHAHHEDRHVQPLVARVAPQLAHELAYTHAELETRATVVRHAFERTVSATGHERIEWAQAAHAELASFVGAHLVHMAFEERNVMAVLWERVRPAELEQTHASLVQSIPTDQMLRFLGFMLPAMNPRERAAMLSGVQKGPSERFMHVCATAESVLAAHEWSALRSQLGLSARA